MDYKVNKNDDGFLVDLGDGIQIFVDKSEIEETIEAPNTSRSFKWREILRSTKKSFKLPKPIRDLLFLRSDTDRRNYLESLPRNSFNKLVAAVTYVILKGNVLERALSLGISVPENISNYIKDIEDKVKIKGEITAKNVETAIKGIGSIVSATATILFAIVLFTNPILASILLPLFLTMDVVNLFSGKEDSL